MGAPDIHLRSVGTALPGPSIGNGDLARRLGLEPIWEQWVDAFIGTRSRHLVIDLDTGKPSCTLADLAEDAGRRALDAAGLPGEEIDLVVMATCTPDELVPATVNIVCDRLGIDGVPTYELQSGCTGAVQALDLARQLMAGGRYRNALVAGADDFARFYDLDVDVRTLPPELVVNLALFGDGAGAAVLSTEPGPGSGSARLCGTFVRLVGKGRPPGQILEWYGPADRTSGRPPAKEDYKAIEAAVPEMAREALHEILDTVGWKSDAVHHVLPPQLSGRMTRRILDTFAMPQAREVSVVERIANNGNALAFFQLDELLPRMASGETAVGVAIESSKWIKSAFAVEKP
jgi:3-oxoacyl-[acyl-carrier-protein] synthase III